MKKEQKETEKEIEENGSIDTCEWCKEAIEENEIYFKCEFHKTIFCENCAKNCYLQEIDFRKAPKCKHNFEKKDCIFQKKLKQEESGFIPLSSMSKSAQISFQYLHPELIK